MKFDIDKLSSKLNKVDKDLKKIELDEKIKKYGTFLDSKKEVLQLYMLFMFFGVNQHIIQQFPVNYSPNGYGTPHEYEPD
tara:strand:- start:76 stop:315 length:240 start_codon:yes stop_codon:yes gene_type:complete